MTMVRDRKPILVQDPMPGQNRKALAAAIALEAGARRDVRVADEAARLAAQKCWDMEAQLEELRKVAAPNGSLASEFIASIASGNPCGASVLERSSVASHAKITAAENELNIWTETRLECDDAVREKESAARESKERLARAARVVIANSENVTRLLAGIEEMQTEVINRRVGLRFILFSGLNGELAEADRARIEDLFNTDRLPTGFNSAYNSGWEQHPVHKKWDVALHALMTDAEAALPTEFAGAV